MLLEKGANPNLQLKRRPPYRDVPQDRGGDSILAQGATPLLRAARAGDAPFVELLLKHKALIDLPSKEGVTPLMAAAGAEFGDRVKSGRNRTEEGVLATMKLLVEAGADVNARMVTERRQVVPEGTSQAAAFAFNVRGRPSQMPSPLAVRAPDGTACRCRARVYHLRQVSCRQRRRSRREGRQRPYSARAREGGPPGRRTLPGNRCPARVADVGAGGVPFGWPLTDLPCSGL